MGNIVYNLGQLHIDAAQQSARNNIASVLKAGNAPFRSAFILGKFDTFTDDDWDEALIIWWQCLAVFFFFGGAISAAVWA